MFSISCNKNVRVLLRRKLFTLKSWSLILLVGIIASFLCSSAHANAVESAILQYHDLQTSMPIAQLRAFAENNQISEDLQVFLQRVSLSPEAVRHLLTDSISLNQRVRLERTTAEFLAIQLHQLVGNPDKREPTDAAKKAVISTIESGSNLSIFKLIEAYPEPLVRVELSRLERMHKEVSRLRKIMQPLMGVVNELLLGCKDETVPEGPAKISASVDSFVQGMPPKSLSAERQGQLLDSLNRRAGAIAEQRAIAQSETPASEQSSVAAGKLLSSQATPDHPLPSGAQQIVFTYGPFQQSLPISELLVFTETGQASNALKFLLKVAKVNPESLQILTREVTVNLRWLDQGLNSILGEYVLFQVGQIIHTPTAKANIQALRAALVRSAVNDNRISAMEFLQNYPLQQVYIDGIKINRLVRNVKQAGGANEFILGKIRQLKDFLVKLQAHYSCR